MIEVYHNGEWRTICDDSWDDNDATVVCRQLGFLGPGTAVCCGQYGHGADQVWLSDVTCTGFESNIGACGNSGWGNHNCVQANNAGVRCQTGMIRSGKISPLRFYLLQ